MPSTLQGDFFCTIIVTHDNCLIVKVHLSPVLLTSTEANNRKACSFTCIATWSKEPLLTDPMDGASDLMSFCTVDLREATRAYSFIDEC